MTISITTMKSQVAFLAKQQDELKAQDANGLKELTELLVLVKAFIAEQTVINRTVAQALDGMIHKIEMAEKAATEAGAIHALLGEIVSRKREVA